MEKSIFIKKAKPKKTAQPSFFVMYKVSLYILSQGPSLLPSSCEEVDHTRDGVAVGRESVAKHEAVKSPAKVNSEEPAKTDTEHHSVEKCQHHR